MAIGSANVALGDIANKYSRELCGTRMGSATAAILGRAKLHSRFSPYTRIWQVRNLPYCAVVLDIADHLNQAVTVF